MHQRDRSQNLHMCLLSMPSRTKQQVTAYMLDVLHALPIMQMHLNQINPHTTQPQWPCTWENKRRHSLRAMALRD